MADTRGHPYHTDIELGTEAIVLEASSRASSYCSPARWFRRLLGPWGSTAWGGYVTKSESVFQGYQIEDHPKGYPRFASLMAAHDSFQIFRRFSALRTRLLLLSQDQVMQLETRLRDIDQAEPYPAFLGSSRRDRNQQRAAVVSEIRTALKDYDELLDRSRHVLTLGPAHSQDITSIQNWISANACISRAELKFLDHRDDLICLPSPGDSLLSWLERTLSQKVLSYSNRYRSLQSRDPLVHIYSRSHRSALARILLAPFLVSLVVIPIVICNRLDSLNARLAILVAATSTFLMALAVLTKGKVLELAIAGVTYTTVLVVFISQPTV